MRKLVALSLLIIFAAGLCFGCSVNGNPEESAVIDENFEAFLRKSEEIHAEQAQQREEQANATPTPEPTQTAAPGAALLADYEQPEMWAESYDFDGFKVDVGATPTLPETDTCEAVTLRAAPFSKEDLATIEALFNSGGLCTVEGVGAPVGANEELVYNNSGLSGKKTLSSGTLTLPGHGGATIEILNLDSDAHLLYKSGFAPPGIDGISPRDAEETALAAAEALGGAYLKPAYVYLGYTDGSKEPVYYGVEMRRGLGGINCAVQTEAINLGSAFFAWQSELMTLHISHAGVTYLSWGGRLKETPGSGKDALLLPFGDIKESFTENAGEAIMRSAAVMSGEAASPLAISRIALEYAYTDGEQESRVLTPVWAFYTEAEYAGRYSFAHYAPLLIDAQTGRTLIAFPEE